MKTYKGDNELWEAFRACKKLCKKNSEKVGSLQTPPMLPPDLQNTGWHDIIYIFMNPQMNRMFAYLDNGKSVDYDVDLWGIHNDEWVDYNEKEEEIKKNTVREMTIQEIEEKLGYKVKIVK